MKVNCIIIQRKEEVNSLTVCPGFMFRCPDDGKIVAPLDKGGIIKIHVDPVTEIVKQVGNRKTGTVDPVPGFSSNQD